MSASLRSASLRQATSWLTAAPRGSFGRVFAAIALALLVSVSALTIWFDPYWVFRDEPPWLRQTGGANNLIDLEMRRVKAHQLMARPHGTVLAGSSTVYHGLNPRDVRPAREPGIYNLGIAAVMAAELPTIAELVIAAGGVERVVLGLDYFSFSGFPPPPPLRPDLATRIGRAVSLVGAAISTRSLERLDAAALGRPTLGQWQYSGFKVTPDFNVELTRYMDAAQQHAAMVYRPEAVAHLARALDLLKGREVALYLSPVSGAQMKGLLAAGHETGFNRWRADVATLAASRRLRFADLALDHPFDDFDPGRGSSRYWIDNLHFKPVVGRWVLERLGLAN
jgi:hypothetical protein